MSFIIEVPSQTIYNAAYGLRTPDDTNYDYAKSILNRIEKQHNVTIKVILNAGYSVKFSSEADATMFLLRFS